MVRKLNQIGIAVKDMDKAIKFYEEVMDIGPFQVIERPEEECILRGEPSKFKLKTGFARVEGVQYELIQVMEGKSAHSEFLESGKEGVHHFGFYVDNLEEEIEKCAQNNIGILAQGDNMGVKWAYMDSAAACGTIQEFIMLPKPKKRKKRKKKEPVEETV
jgi:catechol 2,3-dioxygenase-like lactoylglutathione lyase family enzyme